MNQAQQYRAYHVRGRQMEEVTSRATWTVEPSSLAVFSDGQPGLLKTVQTGSGTIRATVDGASTTTRVTVSAETVHEIMLAPPRRTVSVGQRQGFRALALLDSGRSLDVTQSAEWKTRDEAVAIASQLPGELGLVLGVSPGTTSVIARFAGIEGEGTVTVAAPDGDLIRLRITPADFPPVAVGTLIRYDCIAVFASGLERSVTTEARWSSSDERVATVSILGRQRTVVVTATGPGMATISCEHSGKVGTTTITVRP